MPTRMVLLALKMSWPVNVRTLRTRPTCPSPDQLGRVQRHLLAVAGRSRRCPGAGLVVVDGDVQVVVGTSRGPHDPR